MSARKQTAPQDPDAWRAAAAKLDTCPSVAARLRGIRRALVILEGAIYRATAAGSDDIGDAIFERDEFLDVAREMLADVYLEFRELEHVAAALEAIKAPGDEERRELLYTGTTEPLE
jgi:hypothetical protein